MSAKTKGEMFEEMEAADINVPWVYRWSQVSHYYGNVVRQLLVVAAVLLLIGAPFYSDNLATELPFIVIGAIILVCISALTSPAKRSFISADAVASGVGLVIFQFWALQNYQSSTSAQFLLRQIIALIFLFALYFSTKTLRSMILHQVGFPQPEFTQNKLHDFHKDVPRPLTTDEEPMESWKDQAREALHELNEHEKIDFND